MSATRWGRPLPIAVSRDVVLAVAVALVLGTLVVPLPSALLDVLLAGNLALSALVLVSALLADRPLALSTFPTLLLLTTLYRLALNVSTTRLILSRGSAGEVVEAFAGFVLRGDLAVGVVIFVVLTLVQLMVVAKGAERVAEVGARFTLDALPGKQMSIDADLRSGNLDEAAARRLRAELGRESHFYGAMDGAMKFVKGDAIAGLVITAINLVAGLALGVLRDGLLPAEAAALYGTLSVGDGLVSQIPSLLVSLSAGLLVTRVASPEGASVGLARTLEVELLASEEALGIGAGFAFALALVPGLPLLPFACIGLGLGGAALLRRRAAQGAAAAAPTPAAALAARVEDGKKKAPFEQVAPSVSLLGIELATDLSEAFGFGQGRDGDTELLGVLVPQLRESLLLDTGVRIPGARIRTHVGSLAAGTFRVLVKEVPVAQGHVDPARAFAVARPERLARLGVADARPAPHPLTAAPCAFVPADDRGELERLGIQMWSPQGYVALFTLAHLREHLPDFIGVQEVSDLLEQMRKVYPALVAETVPKVVGLPELVEVLRGLVRERISIRDLRSILDALAELGGRPTDGLALVEWVRGALRLQIGHAASAGLDALGVVLVRPEVEDLLEDAVVHTPTGRHLALEPELRFRLLQQVAHVLEPVVQTHARAVLVTRPEVRVFLRRLLEPHFPFAVVLAHDELPPRVEIRPVAALGLV